jgi:integrase
MTKVKDTQIKNTGSIVMRGDKYRVTLSIGYNDDGTRSRISRTFDTIQEANEFRIQKLADYQRYGTESVKQATGKFVDNYFEWMVYEKKPTVLSRHFNLMMTNYHRLIKPNLARIYDKDVTSKVLKDFFRKLEQCGVGFETMRKLKVQLRQYFEYSMQNSPMRNPTDQVRLVKKKENRIVTPEEMQSDYKAIKKDVREKFLQALSVERHSPFLKPMCYLMFFIGIRIGECLALQWKDFDFENRYFCVYKAVTREFMYDDKGKRIGKSKMALGAPKSKDGIRPLPLIDILYETMLEWKAYKKAQDIPKLIHFTEPDDFVFGTDMGELRSEWGTNTIFKRFLKRNGLENEGIHFHALRQTFSNSMFATETDEQVIKDTIGHANISTTKKHYMSIEKFDSVKKVAQHLNALYPPKNLENRASDAIKFAPEDYITETEAIRSVAEMTQQTTPDEPDYKALFAQLATIPEFQELLRKIQGT